MDPTESGEMFSTVSISSKSGDEAKVEEQRRKKGCFPVRYNLMILGWCAAACAYSLRFDLSIAMVAMVNQTFAENFMANTSHNFTSFCPSPYNKSSKPGNLLSTGDIDWTPSQQGVVLAAFFIGYFSSQIPWGILTQKYSCKHIVGFGLFVSAVLSFLTPPAAETSFILIVIIRGLMGVTQGGIFPGLMSLIGTWVPIGERSIFSNVVGIGAAGGAITATYITAFFSGHPWLGGWHSPFYIFGGTACVWFIFWNTSIYNSPAEHPRISKEELKHIDESLMSSTADEKDIKKIPWSSILKSVSLWLLYLMLFSNNWLSYVQLTFMPTYMEVILGLDMNDNGLYSSLPYLSSTCFSILSGIIADCMIRRGVSLNTTRKTIAGIGMTLASFTFMTVPYLGCRNTLVIMMFIINNACGSFADGGTAVTIIDFAPRYTGVIYGICNCISSLAGVLAPLVTGYLINEKETLDQWKKVFFLASGVNGFGILSFLLFAKVEKAPWADGITETEEAKAKLLGSTPADKIHTKNYGTVVS